MFPRTLLLVPVIVFGLGLAGDSHPLSGPVKGDSAPLIDVVPMETRPAFGDDDGGPRTKRIRPVRSMGQWDDIVDADRTTPDEVTVLWS